MIRDMLVQYMVRGTWIEIHGSRYVDINAWFEVYGQKYMVQGM